MLEKAFQTLNISLQRKIDTLRMIWDSSVYSIALMAQHWVGMLAEVGLSETSRSLTETSIQHSLEDSDLCHMCQCHTEGLEVAGRHSQRRAVQVPDP